MSSKRKNTSILERVERRTEYMRAENRKLQEKLYNPAEAEMLLLHEDDIVANAIKPPRTSPATELQRQLQGSGAISIGAEIHAIRELRDERGSHGGERRGGSSRAGSSRAGSSRAGPSKSKNRTSKKH